MKFAFIYDGQGAQVPQMGLDLYETYPVFRNTFESVDPTGKYRELCFKGTAEQLADTRNTQPCLVALEVSLTALMESVGFSPTLSFGLSLGCYSALAASGSFTPKQAVDAVAYRAQVMAEAGAGHDYAMVAILGLTEEQVQEACGEGSKAGYVTPTNFNCPGQVVISGEKPAVEAACLKAEKLGANHCMPLSVSGPFHTKVMEPAGQKLLDYFKDNQPAIPTKPMLFDTTGEPLGENQTVAQMLAMQVQSPIRFDRCVENMVRFDINTAVELGAGNSLVKLVRRINPKITRISIYDVESFERACSKLKSQKG